ncbi:serine protease, S1-C subfamily, contains C-terminal PDZ domain [Rhodococcus tukisamuensis]|uniref:Serine protease, S1-C subfamily, contains C-terminal PDZ domain n=2 Tax=Rhodococcus tukisamuensis TaxID=168276 RepID=A0A1G6MH79_9NOCA|nr:serine protease, S1-C subfamily, contains C-terminal PDZ domain [Rhodococcus tukisamuensis]
MCMADVETDRTARRRPRHRRGLRLLLAALAAVALALVGTRLDTEPPRPTVVATPEVSTPAPAPLSPEELAARVVPTIVTVTSSTGLKSTAGTGIVLSEDGLVLTNHHVVDGAVDVSATAMATGRSYDAEVLGYDTFRDVAVLRLGAAEGLPVATLGDSTGLRLHDPVTAIGNAEGAGLPVASPGRVTGLNESVTARSSGDGSRNRLTGMIEVDADVRPGDSGGPLVDAAGRVVGVSTAGNPDNRPDAPAADHTGITSYAIPIDDAMGVAGQVREGRTGGTVHVGPTPFLGIAVTNSPTLQDGARVVAVGFGSPAEQAGIRSDDLITSWSGTPIRSASDLTYEMTARHPGDRVEIGWVDATGAARTASLVLGAGPP